MSLIKRKLGSKAGASMLLALVFLMFCLLIGGSVLAAATANGSRVAHLKNDQQDYLSQRSAMLLMADMLTGKDGEELQVVITTITTEKEGSEPTSTATITCPTLQTGETPSILQKMLFEIVVGDYESLTPQISKLAIGNLVDVNTSKTGKISITATINETTNSLTANYDASADDYTLLIDFGTNSFVSLLMDGSKSEGTPKIVTIGNTTTTTTTTVIRWSTPVIEKRGA